MWRLTSLHPRPYTDTPSHFRKCAIQHEPKGVCGRALDLYLSFCEFEASLDCTEIAFSHKGIYEQLHEWTHTYMSTHGGPWWYSCVFLEFRAW